jgi:type IV pilus assembly protein PilV
MRKQNGGFTLIEVLVSVVIISIGLLGMASLMITSLKQSNAEVMQTQAMQSGASMIEKLRSLPNVSFVSSFDSIPSPVDCEESDCSTESMRDYYIREWKCLLGNYVEKCNIDADLVVLPEGDAKIVSDNGLITITIKWLNIVTGDEYSWEVQSDD